MNNSRFRVVLAASVYLAIVAGFLLFTHSYDGTTQRTRPYALDFGALAMSWTLVGSVLLGIQTAWTDLRRSGEDSELPVEAAALPGRAAATNAAPSMAGHSRAHA